MSQWQIRLFGGFVVAAMALSSRADVVTLVRGESVRGKVVSLDAKVVVVEGEGETRRIPREKVRKIELGDALVTGFDAGVYTNADYRLRLALAAGWKPSAQPDMDFSATKGETVLMLKGIPLTGGFDNMVRGAVAGMTANVPGSHASEPRSGKWAGYGARFVSVDSPQASLEVVLVDLPRHMLMILAAGGAGTAKEVRAAVTSWESSFRFLEGE